MERLEGLAAFWAVWCGAWFAFAPRWFAAATAGAAVVFLGLAAGPAPVATVLLFLASCGVAGALVFPRAESQMERTVAGAAIWMTAIGILAHFPLNYAWVYLAGMLGVLALRPAVTRDWWERTAGFLRPEPVWPVPARIALGLAAFPILGHMLVALKPEVGSDALAVHLNVPMWVAWKHSFHFDFKWLSWSLMPLGADWLYTAVYLPGGESAARLLDFAFLCLVVFSVYRGARQFVGRGAAAVMAGLMASTPVTQLVTGSLLVENVQATWIVAAFFSLDRLRRTGEAVYLRMTMLLLGAALATKFGSFAFVAPLAAFALWEAFRRGLSAWSVLWAGPGLLPYAYAWVSAGNPIFPFANNVFKSPWFDSRQAFADPIHSLPIGFGTPWRMLFETHTFLESRDGALGLYLPVLAAVLLAGRVRGWTAYAALATALSGCLITFEAVAYVRYIYAAIPLLLIAGAAALGALERDRPLFRASIAVFAVCIAVDTWLLPSSGWYHGDFYLNPFNAAQREETIRLGAPVREIAAYLNRAHPGEAAAFFDSGDLAGLRAKAYMVGWHTEAYSRRVIGAFRSADYGDIAQDYGIRVFVAPAEWAKSPGDDILRRFLALYTVTEFTYGRMEVRRLKPGAAAQWRAEASASAPPEAKPNAVSGIDGPPCSPTLVDDTSPLIHYAGTWRKVDRFGASCGGTLAFSDFPDAEATFEFSGTSVTWVYTKAVRRGRGEAWIDGRRVGVVDQFAPCVRQEPGCLGIVWHAQTTFGGLTPGPHTLKIRVLREKDPRSTDYAIDVDGFAVK